MKGLENNLFLVLLVISNLAAMLLLLAAVKWPRIARASFIALFAWACWMNWRTCITNPQSYLEYGNLTFSSWYREFINGWFAAHTRLCVGIIASCQGLIALSFVAKGILFRASCTGAILFLLFILPLGVGSGFPCSGIMAVAVYILMRKCYSSYLWDTVKKNTATS